MKEVLLNFSHKENFQIFLAPIFYSVLQQFNVFFGQKMPLKLLQTLMSNWINVEDDIDHDEDEDVASKMIPEMVTLTRYIL